MLSAGFMLYLGSDFAGVLYLVIAVVIGGGVMGS